MSSVVSRRTAEQVLQAIRKTVMEQVHKSGYASVTFAGIARASGVGKPALYRRFPDRATMVYDAMFSVLDAFVPPPPTGSLRSDLIAWYADAQGRGGSVLSLACYRGVAGEAKPETLALIHASSERIAGLIGSHVIQPAQRAGELGPNPLSSAVIYAPIRVLRDQALFDREEIDLPTFVDEIALPLYRGASGWVPVTTSN
ncbi:MAG: TetR/AcrR family transcriptional regulator [Pseudoxanthomonas sp.]